MRVTVYVAVDPITAFEIFTEEIDVWYRRGPHHFFDPARAAAIRFEPGVGGRLVEVDTLVDDARGRLYRLRPTSLVALQAWLDQVQASWSEQLGSFKSHAERHRGRRSDS